MSLPADLCNGAIDHIAAALSMETTRDDQLVSAMDGSDVGAHRVLEGGGVRLVSVSMVVPAFGLDSHMLFAFTGRDSAVPHFTLDSVNAGPFHAFHLDMIPRVDPGANLAYIDHCFSPLTAAHDAAGEIEGLTAAQLSPRQWQLMSAWMLAQRADESAFASINPTVDAYRDHWLTLVSDGLPAGIVDVDAAQLAARDLANRSAIFSPEVDPVWGRVDQLLGPDVSANIQASLIDA